MLKLVLYYSLHKLDVLCLEKLHQHIFQEIFFGKNADSIKEHVNLFIAEHLNSYLYIPAVQKLQSAKKNQDFISLLSNSPDFLVGPIASFLKIEDWKGTVYEIDKTGHFSKISSFFEGDQKAEYLKSLCKRFNLLKENVVAYSDSFLDLPFLMEAGKVVAVNPDRKLKLLSQQNKWEII